MWNWTSGEKFRKLKELKTKSPSLAHWNAEKKCYQKCLPNVLVDWNFGKAGNKPREKLIVFCLQIPNLNEKIFDWRISIKEQLKIFRLSHSYHRALQLITKTNKAHERNCAQSRSFEIFNHFDGSLNCSGISKCNYVD